MNDHNLITKLLSGDEQFVNNGESLGLTVRDFWSFQFSNILHDPDEIAEFLVAKALDLEAPCNKLHWTLYDIDYRGKRIEVKETAYYHSFNEPGEVSSQRSFGIQKANSEYEDANTPNRYERQNDLYVFCLLNGTTSEEAWPLEVSHWEFYVVPTSLINEECGDQKTVSLSRVRSFAEPVSYKELRDVVDKTIDEIESTAL